MCLKMRKFKIKHKIFQGKHMRENCKNMHHVTFDLKIDDKESSMIYV